VTDHYKVSREDLLASPGHGLRAEGGLRKENHVNYFKQSAAIEDFLTTIGAPISAMSLMSKKIEKDMRNAVNRKVNCDARPTWPKRVDAALQHIDIIEQIEQSAVLTACRTSCGNGAAPAGQPGGQPQRAAGLLNVTKSCLSHRLRKLQEIASKLGGPGVHNPPVK
jgi:DNA-binding transcriptional regulator WhiA